MAAPGFGKMEAGHQPGISLIDRVSQIRTIGLPFAAPKLPLRTVEASMVRDVLQMLQGFPSKSFLWEASNQRFQLQNGVHLSHLSPSSLGRLLHPFVCAATSLRRVEAFVKRVATASCNLGSLSLRASPTLQAFARSTSLRVEQLRKAAVELELVAVAVDGGTSVTLLSLLSSLSWVCAGAEFLEQVVDEAIPHKYILQEDGISAGELGAHILSFLYNKMSEFCLLEDGEEEPHSTLLMLFAGSLHPLTESLDEWLHEGNLNDPFGELFFHANNSVAIEHAAFWQHGFHLRCFEPWNNSREKQGRKFKGITTLLSSSWGSNTKDRLVCPNFLQPIAKSILSAGKSLQLLQYVRRGAADDCNSSEPLLTSSSFLPLAAGSRVIPIKQQKAEDIRGPSNDLSVQALKDVHFFDSFWHRWTMPTSKQRGLPQLLGESSLCEAGRSCFTPGQDQGCETSICRFDFGEKTPFFFTTLEKLESIDKKKDLHSNLVGSCILPPLNDGELREAIFKDVKTRTSAGKCSGTERGTDYGHGSGCGNLLMRHAEMDFRAMEHLFSFPTNLPSCNEGLVVSNLLPAWQRNRVASVISDWLQKTEYKVTPLPEVLVQECLIRSIKKQVEAVGKQVLSRLMGEWRLMEELSVLRAVYLIGSGDLLQQFSLVLFNKLDRGEPWDDFYELNTMLQESVRSSADGMLLPALDSLVVTVQPQSNLGGEQGSGPVPLHFAGWNLTFGIDTLDSLFFLYKVTWPLELIIDRNAIKKYNQVMAFLFKVKRAKFALDKACRWMWKNGAGATNLKQQLLLQQKLMHFVNTLHQYVMDRVLYNAWVELCDGMASAGSLDEVIACHDAYLVSIQRQCLVAPDKLWALISSRVKTILSLALDFYSIQRTLCGGGAAPAITARCQLEIDRVGRQFDECIVFLLRVLSFKLNVGHFPHLAELVTRINYNYYYISESGHLLTPLPEISSGRGFQQAKVVRSYG